MKSRINRYILALLLAAGSADASQSHDENLLRRRNYTPDSEKTADSGESPGIFSSSDINITQRFQTDKDRTFEERSGAEKSGEKNGGVSSAAVPDTYHDDNSRQKEIRIEEQAAQRISDEENHSLAAQEQNSLKEHAGESASSPESADRMQPPGKLNASSSGISELSDNRLSLGKPDHDEVRLQDPKILGSSFMGSLSSDTYRRGTDISENDASASGTEGQASDHDSGKVLPGSADSGALENSRAFSVPASSGSARVSGDYAADTAKKETVQPSESSSGHSRRVPERKNNEVSDKTTSAGQSKVNSYDLNRETVITVRRGVNEIIPISLGYVNRIVTPFAHPEVVSSSVFSATDSCEEFCIRGNVIYITVSDSRPVAMFVTEQGRPEKSISVTMLPKQIPPREVTFRFPEGSGAQPDFKGNDRAMRFEHSSDYITSIKKILKSAALNKIPEGYELHETGTDQSVPYCAQSGLEFRFKSPWQYMMGYSFAVYIGVVQNTSDRDIEFDETSCSAHDVAAVAAWPRIYLSPGEKTELFVVRRMYHENGSKELFRPNLLRSR